MGLKRQSLLKNKAGSLAPQIGESETCCDEDGALLVRGGQTDRQMPERSHGAPSADI